MLSFYNVNADCFGFTQTHRAVYGFYISPCCLVTYPLILLSDTSFLPSMTTWNLLFVIVFKAFWVFTFPFVNNFYQTGKRFLFCFAIILSFTLLLSSTKRVKLWCFMLFSVFLAHAINMCSMSYVTIRWTLI